MVLVVRMDSKRVFKFLDNLPIKLSKNLTGAREDLAREMKRNLRFQLTVRKHRFEQGLYDSVKVKFTKERAEVSMRRYGLAVDDMRRHVVWLRKGRKITRWAKAKGIQGFVMKKLSAKTGQTERGIWVQGDVQHGRQSYIDKAVLGTFRNAPNILRRRMEKALQEAKA